ncbi:MAG: HNH endonuclease [Pseudolabrys sp.]|nr:HNH endonuclease [Pseudolabrys sp.]
MAKAIFTIKSGSGYKDQRELHYHFPRTYLNQVEAAKGDSIIYYEPRRSEVGVGLKAYFATARVVAIDRDPDQDDHFYARVADYLDFDKPVRFNDDGKYYESRLQKDDGSTNKGAFGRAVRPVSEVEFDLILRAGFSAELDFGAVSADSSGFDEPVVEFERPMVEMTISRPFRDRAFMTAVRYAYENRCAVTGLMLINGGGRPEVQAAHIQPVASSGPDAIRNGIALSGTFHWLFDRGLISVGDDHRILVADKVPEQARRMLNADGKILTPQSEAHCPSPYFLKFHRENVFKGE